MSGLMSDPESQMDFHLQKTCLSISSGEMCVVLAPVHRVSCMCYTALHTLQNTACASMQIYAVPHSSKMS